MKKIIEGFLALSLLVSTPVFAKSITVHVEGVVCAFCVQGIKKQFKKIDSVEKVNVDMDAKTVQIKTTENQDIPDPKIKKLIKNAGYNVSRIER